MSAIARRCFLATGYAMARKENKPKKGIYRPVNQAGFKSIFAGSLGAKAKRGKRRLRESN